MSDLLMPSAFQPPSDLADIPAWLLEQEEEIARITVRALDQIIERSLTAFISSLTAAGDMSAFDAIPSEWSTFVNRTLADRLGGLYLSGGISAWIQSPMTPAISAETAQAWTDVINDQAVSYAGQATKRLTGPVSDSIWNDLRQKVSSAIQTGKSTEALAEEIRLMGEFSRHRAETIARTEANGAYNAGNYQSAQTLGDVGPVEKYWISTADDRTRPSHREADGQTRAFADPFIIGGSEMLYPHDPAGPAKEIVNCRCVVGYLYPGMERPDGSIVPSSPAQQAIQEAADQATALQQIRAGGIPEEGWASPRSARAYLEDRHPQVHWGSSIDSWDRLTVRDVAKWADSMGEAYPDRWARMRYVGDQTSDLTGLPADLRGKILRYDWNGQTHFAHAYTEQAMSQDIGIIAINPSYARAHAGMMDKIRQAHETGFFLPENVEDVLTHEFGHVWHGLTIRQAMIERITGRAATVRFTDEAIDLGGWSEFHDWVIRDWAKPRMVDYGSVYGASKPVETVAEAFVARHKGLGGEIPKLIDALEIGAQRTKGFNDIVRTSDESRLAGMELIDSILREAGIRARPQGWARTRDRLIAETERIRRIVEEA